MTTGDLRPRVVFDCMIYLQATANESSPAGALLRMMDDSTVSLLVSNDILDEVRDVLSRPKVRQKNPRVTDERVDALLTRLVEKGTLVESVPKRFSYERDPKDEKYINLAVEADAAFLVSRDNDLLDLMQEDLAGSRDFRQQFPTLTILNPVAFLRQMEQPPTQQNIEPQSTAQQEPEQCQEKKDEQDRK
jgi:putative PIN family toxin of toxin-antitoxin system